MKRTKFKKMTRTKFKKDPFRKKLEQAATCYHSHLKKWFENANTKIVLAFCHPGDRDSLVKELGYENYQQYLQY